MKTPKYTDLFRWSRPYRSAVATNVGATFAAEYRRLAELAKKPTARVTRIRGSA